MKHVHFSVALRHLLQQLEQQPKDGLQVLGEKKKGRAQQVLDKQRRQQQTIRTESPEYSRGETGPIETQSRQQVIVSQEQ